MEKVKPIEIRGGCGGVRKIWDGGIVVATSNSKEIKRMGSKIFF